MGFWSPTSIVALYLDPLGITAVGTVRVCTGAWGSSRSLEALAPVAPDPRELGFPPAEEVLLSGVKGRPRELNTKLPGDSHVVLCWL